MSPQPFAYPLLLSSLACVLIYILSIFSACESSPLLYPSMKIVFIITNSSDLLHSWVLKYHEHRGGVLWKFGECLNLSFLVKTHKTGLNNLWFLPVTCHSNGVSIFEARRVFWGGNNDDNNISFTVVNLYFKHSSLVDFCCSWCFLYPPISPVKAFVGP